MLKYKPPPAIAAHVAAAAPAALAQPPDYDTDDEGHLCEPKPAKRKKTQTHKVAKSMMTEHVRGKRWEYGYFWNPSKVPYGPKRLEFGPRDGQIVRHVGA